MNNVIKEDEVMLNNTVWVSQGALVARRSRESITT